MDLLPECGGNAQSAAGCLFHTVFHGGVFCGGGDCRQSFCADCGNHPERTGGGLRHFHGEFAETGGKGFGGGVSCAVSFGGYVGGGGIYRRLHHASDAAGRGNHASLRHLLCLSDSGLSPSRTPCSEKTQSSAIVSSRSGTSAFCAIISVAVSPGNESGGRQSGRKQQTP